MSTTTTVAVPTWDLPDRLRKALRHADVSVQDMAEYLEVNRNTISAWINGRNRPSAAAVKLWALRCGVPYEWLAHGIEPRWAAGDSNPEPEGYRLETGRPRLDPAPAGISRAELEAFMRQINVPAAMLTARRAGVA